MQMLYRRLTRCLALGLIGLPFVAHASSHREAPQITETPKVDGTDFYLFRSYEPNKDDTVTVIANYLPLQDAYGGPNYFTLDPKAVYDLHIDNNGDAAEDLTFRFRVTNTIQDVSIPTGLMSGGAPVNVAVPIVTTTPGGIGPAATMVQGLNVVETYTVELIRGARTNTGALLSNANGGSTTFTKPVDYVGQKSIPNYGAYANNHIYSVNIPGCATAGRVFVGQRRESFSVNLGPVFDLVNFVPVDSQPRAEHGTALGGGAGIAQSANNNIIRNKNITAFAVEVPIACLTSGADPVIGGWTSASLPQGQLLNRSPRFNSSAGVANPAAGTPGATNATVEGGALTQVSRLGGPLINELVIGMRDKDAFNASRPADDLTKFATYVAYPTLPALLQSLFNVTAPATPRNDLVSVFVTGIKDINRPANLVRGGEMIRLNTSIAPKAPVDQHDLGVLGGDTAGYPNGRRPGDDVVDISLLVVEGRLYQLNDPDKFGANAIPANAPSSGLAYTDGAPIKATDFDATFPYLKMPAAGATN
jgi:hypothetical protein